MSDQIILCGNGCGHDHESPNGPTGCCPEHGPYMYFCADCADERGAPGHVPTCDPPCEDWPLCRHRDKPQPTGKE